MQGEAGGANGFWKWVAALLVAIMLSSLPGIVHAYRSPSREEVDSLRERQETIFIRLAQIDEKISSSRELIAEVKRELEVHQDRANIPR